MVKNYNREMWETLMEIPSPARSDAVNLSFAKFGHIIKAWVEGCNIELSIRNCEGWKPIQDGSAVQFDPSYTYRLAEEINLSVKLNRRQANYLVSLIGPCEELGVKKIIACLESELTKGK